MRHSSRDAEHPLIRVSKSQIMAMMLVKKLLQSENQCGRHVVQLLLAEGTSLDTNSAG